MNDQARDLLRRAASAPRTGGPAGADPASTEFPWGPIARNAAKRWWQRHPANAAGQLARPLLARYARDQPGKLLAIAAAAGAVAVLTRPWRVLPATMLVGALFKSSDIADFVTTLMDKNKPEKDPR